jgi:hypothetical protein
MEVTRDDITETGATEGKHRQGWGIHSNTTKNDNFRRVRLIVVNLG